jgi:hypothetical protein
VTVRLAPPWSIEELDDCFIVKDASGQKLGYFYYEEEARPEVEWREFGNKPL